MRLLLVASPAPLAGLLLIVGLLLLGGCASTYDLDPLAAPSQSFVKALCAEPAPTEPKWEDGGCV